MHGDTSFTRASEVVDVPTAIIEAHSKEVPLNCLSPAIVKEIAEDWAKLTPEEKTALTAKTIKELEERRENCLEGTHNTQLAACHDACVTLKKVKTEVRNLQTSSNAHLDMLPAQKSSCTYQVSNPFCGYPQ